MIFQVGKDESEERNNVLQELQELTNKESGLIEKLQQYKDNDPELYEKMNSDIKVINFSILCALMKKIYRSFGLNVILL